MSIQDIYEAAGLTQQEIEAIDRCIDGLLYIRHDPWVWLQWIMWLSESCPRNGSCCFLKLSPQWIV